MPKLQADQLLRFGPYRLDPMSGQLWRGTLEVKLTPKALAVLRHLAQQPGQVVSKEEFFRAVWADTVVSDAALTSCIQELRQALHDEARNPRYIETVHRRGFRFIGKVVSDQLSVVSPPPTALPRSQLATGNWQLTTPLVGREAELQQLHECLEKALHGERQIIFVTGEPGIGKTTLVEAFLHQVAAEDDLWLGRGQCIEHYGAGEAYLPLLAALGRLGRESGGERFIQLLSQYAPTWLGQMPALLSAADLEALQRKTAGVTRERMLRELAEAIEVVTRERPLVLVLEDLHWSDVSTLDWLAFLARRSERTRLLVIGTYRPVEVLTREHPLKAVKQELQVHGHCQELALDFLREEDVAKYLAVRFPVGTQNQEESQAEVAPLRSLARAIHQRTDGNPLFMINLVNDLVARGVLVQSDGRWELKGRVEEVEGGVPESLQQLIAQQIERLRPETQRMLEVASVAGAEFSAAVVAAGMETEVDVVEEQCEELVRREHFLRASGTADWPDGTVATRYGFLHALYQEVLYHRLTARRRQRLHQQIGEREEQGYGEQVREIAAELAVHFEWGREYRKAIQYLQQAGENASRRSAYAEAISLFTRGLELLKTLPDTPERVQQELTLQPTLGAALMATRGYAAVEVVKAYARAHELCQQVGGPPRLFPILGGLFGFYLNRAELQTAHELAEQLQRLAQNIQDPALFTEAHHDLGVVLYFLGEFTSARKHLEQGLALYDSQERRSSGPLQNPRVSFLCWVAPVLYFLGYPDQALQRGYEALTLARELDHSFSLALALTMLPESIGAAGSRTQPKS